MDKPGCSVVLKAMADSTRWRIVQALLDCQKAKVLDLVDHLKVSQPNISKHLQILRNAGVVISEKEGNIVWCQINPKIRMPFRDEAQALDLGCCEFRFARRAQETEDPRHTLAALPFDPGEIPMEGQR
jgi:DNA-binding transcriptional ArsR family regulator